MPKLTPTQLSKFQTISNDSFPLTLEIWKRTQTTNNRGGILEIFAAITEPPTDLNPTPPAKLFKGRANISTRVPSERVYGEQETGVKLWDVFVPRGTNLAVGDKVVLTEDRTELKIIGIESTVNETVAKRCYAIRIT